MRSFTDQIPNGKPQALGDVAGVPDAVRHYLAHTGAGVSIRDLARTRACHASTILRQIRRVEQQRDDPLIDAALRRMETRLQPDVLAHAHLTERNGRTMEMTLTQDPSAGAQETFEKEALRVLRRLCETGAVLAIAKDMDMAVVVREGPDGSTTRTAVVSQEIAQSIALNAWIETATQGRILRYCITQKGREAVKDLIARHAPGTGNTHMELAEAPAHFDPAPSVSKGSGSARKIRYNLAESPLTVLARRRDKSGDPFLDDTLVRCGERLREDFELAQMGPQDTDNWTDLLEESGPAQGGFGPEAAKSRVVSALRDLGPGLSDVALRCCCYLEGLETTEQQMGWSARSGKIVLRIALQRLKRHYDETLTHDAQMIG